MRNRDDQDDKRRPLREQPFSRLLPNLITIAGLSCGLSSVRFAMDGKWEMSVAFIIAAAFIDGMDGRIARMLGATSVFGAQLDSLSDFVCFGVAPALVLYHWQLHTLKGFGWAAVLFYAVCCALRLARFNTGIMTENKKPWQKQFFTGVPSPAGGILCLWPLIVYLQFEGDFVMPVQLVALYVIAVGSLMASRLPTFAAKNLRIKADWILPVTVACAAAVVLFIIEPWWSLSAFGVLYLLSIGFSLRQYHRLKREDSVGR